ncbi:MAG: tetratricopeptide repeat protein [Bacteroidales bacterium]|nr:tetratricopeptide repeat protein [Bacteroidales bacterium]
MKLFITLLFFVLICRLTNYGQSDKIYLSKESVFSHPVDSLEKRLLTSAGIEKIDLLIELANEIWVASPLKALDYANEALNLSKTHNYKPGLAKSLNALGLTNYTLSRYEVAMRLHVEAMEIAMELNNIEILAATHNHIGMIYWKIKMPEKAIQYFQKFSDYAVKMDDKKLIAKSLNNIGLIYSDQGDPHVGLRYFKDALENSKQIDDYFAMCSSLINMAVVYSKIKDNSKAIIYLFKALDVVANRDNKWLSSIIYNNIGHTYLILEKLDSAVYYSRLGLECAFDLGLKKQISQAYEIISFIYKKQNRFELALSAYEEFVLYKDSVDMEGNLSLMQKLDDMSQSNELREYKIEQENKRLKQESKERGRLHLLYLLIGIIFVISVQLFLIVRNNRRKNRLNTLLAERNRQLQELNNKLQQSEKNLTESNRTKDTLFSIIGHDLRSPFNSLIGFSELLYEEYEELDDTTKKRYISEINMAGTKTFQLLENLLHWSRLQSEKVVLKKEKVSVYNMVSTAVSLVSISASYKRIQIKNIIPESLFVYADSNMISTVFRNLVSNAVKFTPQDGKVQINFTEENDKFIFSVKDSGIGINDKDLKNLFQDNKTAKAGTSGESGTGIGLEICHRFVVKHGGKIWAESTLGKGTSLFFTIPKT